MRTRSDRPVGLGELDRYRAELRERFGRRAALCHMESVGTKSEKRRPYEVAEGIAIINIVGALVHEAWYSDETEYAEIRREVKMAVDDADVSGILLRVSSPGGETDSAFETAAELSEAKKKKPMWAVADPFAYSAGYLLASTAERLYVPPTTGGVGSIGVYALHLDWSGLLKNEGIKPTFISAGTGKTDGNPFEPLSDRAEKSIRSEVDRLYGEFVAHVARERKISEAAIVKLGASLFQGSKASIGAGLADRVGGLDDAWFEMAANIAEKKAKSFSMAASAVVTSSPQKEKVMENTTAGSTTTVEAPVNLDNLRAEAKASGYSEAQEIVELCALAGDAGRAAEFIRDKKPVLEVRKALLEKKADASDKLDVRSGTTPVKGLAEGKPKLAERMRETLKAQGRL